MVLFDINPLPLQHLRALSDGTTSPTFDATEHNAKKSRLSPNLKRRGVRFSRNMLSVAQERIPWTEEEKRKSFYGRKDRRSFENDRINVCKLFEKMYRKGEPWKETKEVTLRGLEDFFGRFSKEQIRKMHSQKVLKEQQRQLLSGEGFDDDTIRYVSCESSGEGRMRAIRQGQQDALNQNL